MTRSWNKIEINEYVLRDNSYLGVYEPDSVCITKLYLLQMCTSCRVHVCNSTGNYEKNIMVIARDT